MAAVFNGYDETQRFHSPIPATRRTGNMIHDIEYETMPREALEAIQLRRLQATLERVYANVPFYRQKFQAAGIVPSDIKRLEDMNRIPFTTKQDLRDNYPFNMFAVPMDNVVRIHASSGTTGQPTVVGYTSRDVGTWSTLMARALAAGGAGRGDIIHNAYGYGLFTGGLGVHYGAERLGASVIPVSGGNTKRQVVIMRDFGPTILTATPSLCPAPGRSCRRDGRFLQLAELQVRHIRCRALVRKNARGDRAEVEPDGRRYLWPQ
jgi:phenylacetate-coenzyme A ligase PaaK-like adenylate-forming protein